MRIIYEAVAAVAAVADERVSSPCIIYCIHAITESGDASAVI